MMPSGVDSSVSLGTFPISWPDVRPFAHPRNHTSKFRHIFCALPEHSRGSMARRLYILCWSEFSRRRLLPAVSPAAGHLTTPTVAGLPGLCENFRPTTSKSSPILRLLSSHWATSVVRTRVVLVGVANVGDSLRRLSSLQHRIYNLLARWLSEDSAICCVLPVLWMTSFCSRAKSYALYRTITLSTTLSDWWCIGNEKKGCAQNDSLTRKQDNLL